MPDLADVTYSREATIAAVTDYYEFLIKLYLKDNQVIFPPEAGWPSIVTADPDILATLGKSDEVLALLAHLPYVRRPGNWNDDAEGAPGCFFADWQNHIESLNSSQCDTTGEELRIITEGFPFCDVAPPHVVGLTSGSRENPVMVLDTKLGIVHWEDCPSDVESEHFGTKVDYDPLDEADVDEDDEDANGEGDADDEEDSDDDEDVMKKKHGKDNDDDKRDLVMRIKELAWRQSAAAWAIPDFFEILKDQFTNLKWIPISQHVVWAASSSCAPDCEGMIPILRDIYYQHGWPDLSCYRKLECLEAVQKLLKERYPSCADVRSG